MRVTEALVEAVSFNNDEMLVLEAFSLETIVTPTISVCCVLDVSIGERV